VSGKNKHCSMTNTSNTSDSEFSQQWLRKWLSSGMWHHVIIDSTLKMEVKGSSVTTATDYTGSYPRRQVSCNIQFRMQTNIWHKRSMEHFWVYRHLILPCEACAITRDKDMDCSSERITYEKIFSLPWSYRSHQRPMNRKQKLSLSTFIRWRVLISGMWHCVVW
jgi:hypothetical protein